jgi:hypothetical protein
MRDYAECPNCGNDKWMLEHDHAHCSECHEVIRFDELGCLILYGKRPIDKLLEDELAKPLP